MSKLEYYVSKGTCAIISIDSDSCQIIDENGRTTVEKSSMCIVNDSCKYFGSSYEGRVSGSKQILNMNYKLPIIVEEHNELILFPTSSPRFDSCVWINLSNIANYERNGNDSRIIFKCGEILDLDISYYSLENQVFRATMLESLIRKRKNM